MLGHICRYKGGALAKVLLLSAVIPLALYAISTGAPAGHTGSPTFREDSCAISGCHLGSGNPNPAGGSVTINGVPASYTPGGAAIPIRVTIQDSTTRRGWGFQLSARFRDGRQAGTFATGSGVRVELLPTTGVQYITHSPAVFQAGTSFTYTVQWTPPASATAGDIVFSAAGNSADGNGQPTNDRIFTTEIVSSAPSSAAARIEPGGIVSAASFTAAPDNVAAPGMLISIFGQNMASGTASATSLPLPIEIGGTSVLIGGVAAPLLFVSAGQINAQVPFEVTAGATVDVVVRAPGRPNSAAEPLRVVAGAPGIFTMPQNGTGQGAILLANTATVVSETDPARPGGFVSVFATGLGLTNPQFASGAAGNAQRTVETPTVTIGGISAEVSFSGAAPGFAGLYQMNIKIPDAAASGDREILIVQSGRPSRSGVTIRVQR